jgi:hypothetical protein
MNTGENLPMKEKEGRNRHLKRLSEQSLEFGSVFKETSRNLFLFLGNKAG